MAQVQPGCIVVFDSDTALVDLSKISSKEERRPIFDVVDKLRQLGPQLVPPHAKSRRAAPCQGRSPSRPILERSGDAYLVLASPRTIRPATAKPKLLTKAAKVQVAEEFSGSGFSRNYSSVPRSSQPSANA